MSTITLNFFTSKINKRKYTDAILEWTFSHFRSKMQIDKILEVNQWTINIFPTYQANYDFGNLSSLNTEIPHGVCKPNDKVIDVFVKDIRNEFVMLQNFMTISHELSHMMLAIYYPDRRSKYRHHDKSWGKKGQEGNFFVTEVHDREKEMVLDRKWIRTISIYRWHFAGRQIGKIYLKCFDITDLTSVIPTK